MTNSSAERITLNATAQNLLRIVIASYFLAVGLNLIPGTNLTILAEQVLPAHVAEPLSAMLVFALAFLVMIGLYMRPAALVLGLMTLFASYLQMIELGVADELGTFWRDLVLIAALMLTYAENAPRDHRMRSAIRRKVTPRRITPTDHPHRARPAAKAVARPAPVAEAPVVNFVSRRKLAANLPDAVDNIFSDFAATG
ncbi:hypothetical protein [Nioella aestuarii]|uniref:hypothetical protein n=1 Tax=Nioella aestuarii TaxID=1662864 RepID=UPI003D7FD94E